MRQQTTMTVEAIPFRDRKGRQRYAVPTYDGREYRILDERGSYLWNATAVLVKNIDGVDLPALPQVAPVTGRTA